MPYNLVPIKIAAVLPQSLCTSFTEIYDFPVLPVSYNDGTYECSLIVDGVNAPRPLRRFVQSKRLAYAQFNALWNFWSVTVQGGLYAFYFYNPFDAAPIGSNYDPTGTNINGRVPVFFRGNWAQQSPLAFNVVSNLMMVETADLVEGIA